MIPFLLFVILVLIGAVVSLACQKNANWNRCVKLSREIELLHILHTQKNSESAKRIQELEKDHKAVSEIVKKQAAAFANLKNENDNVIRVLRDELRFTREKLTSTESQCKQSNATLLTVKGAVDHHFHPEDGS